MKLQVNPDLAAVDWREVADVFHEVGWGERIPEEIESAFRKSTVVCFMKSENKIAAFGRTVDDGRYYALLVDVVVRPEFQTQGLGRKVVEALKEHLVGYNFITLTAAPGKEGFYQKLGWEKQTSSYIFPKDEKQRKEHCG